MVTSSNSKLWRRPPEVLYLPSIPLKEPGSVSQCFLELAADWFVTIEVDGLADDNELEAEDELPSETRQLSMEKKSEVKYITFLYLLYLTYYT